MGMAVIPLAGLVGGAVDVSRLYLTKTRLQQACDAGALAGRKVMGGGAWNANSNAATTVAVNFFDANFQNGAYGTTGRTRAFTESSGKVTGTASAVVPMTIMKIFRQSARTLNVTCDAEMALPNTDVMFVLDVTGSMDEVIPGDTSRKIDGMHRAVKCFYEVLAKLDTTENCGSTPSGGTSSQVQIRFGFVPYSTNVNVGKLLPTSYFANSWTYQSRVARFTTPYYVANPATNLVTYETYGSNISRSRCRDYGDNEAFGSFNPNPEGTPLNAGTAPSATTLTTYERYSWGGNTTPTNWPNDGQDKQCIRRKTVATTTYTTKYSFTDWTYRPEPVSVTNFVADNPVTIATSWNGYVDTAGTYDLVELPQVAGATGLTTASSRWDGCVEERPTVQGVTDFDPIPSAAYDLDIDLVPTSGNANSLWGPVWNDLHYSRRTSGGGSYSYSNRTNVTNNYTNDSTYSCAPEGRLLASWTDATAFESYVDTLQPTANTYHDIGLLWGARLMSPTGIFAAQNATTPNGGTIERHLIFMTDGTAVADDFNQTAYGVAWFDRRQTNPASAPTNAELVTQIQERMQGLCMAVRNKNITLWVIYFGAVSSGDATRMQACATPGKYYAASNNTQLATIFSSIAAQISQLRLTQ
jgi:Flp pilus assembly protein TadG